MKSWFSRLRIRTKISVIYISVLLISLGVTFGMISMINRQYSQREIRDAGIQTVDALAGNLGFIFDNVTQFSNLIYFDDHVQNALKTVESEEIDLTIQHTIQKSLTNMILSGDYISSVFIFDKYLNHYSSYKISPISVNEKKIEKTEWYQQMLDAKGEGFFIYGSEEVLEYPTRPNKKYISYIRQIGNKETYEPIAILLVTIDADIIQKYFEGVSAEYDSQYFIVDGNGNYIIPPNENADEYTYVLKENEMGTDCISEVGGQEVVMVSRDLQIQDWKLIGSFQVDNIAAMAPYYTTVILIIVCLNVVFVFVCSIFLSRLIFSPLSKVESHMKLVEKGQFVEMEITGSDNEINTLKKVFNHMMRSLQEMIQKIKEEENIIAKSELNLLQAQINPHFLYNTLDAISALALMEDYDSCYTMTRALGNFYRNSLNSGMNFVTVRDEIQCIESYITILNIRYANKIQFEYDIEQEVREYFVLKLLLQPIVENSVHHGIKEKGGKGKIAIKAFQNEDELVFVVNDDGVGMTEEQIDAVLSGKSKKGKNGFGVYSLIQRIRLYYMIENPVAIHSEIGSGTEVVIRTGIRNRGDTNEY